MLRYLKRILIPLSIVVFATASVFADDDFTSEDCMACHDVTEHKGAEVDFEELFGGSIHGGLECIDCHVDVTDLDHDEDLEDVDCSSCHDDVSELYAFSTHGKLVAEDDPDAPLCKDCHGTHGILPQTDRQSPAFPTNIPNMCADCHREGNQAAIRYTGEQHEIVKNYTMSIHGKGLLESGLTVTATCTSCHTAHSVLPASDSASSIHHNNIPQTCAQCHDGILQQYEKSVHYQHFSAHDPEAPSCVDCHLAHTITRTDKVGFKEEISQQCGGCHEKLVETYFETFHGKVSRLGYEGAAKCQDCHGSHAILSPDSTHSTLSSENIVETCGKCHEDSHAGFTTYLTHATHKDRENYPALFYAYWFMTFLLVGTLVVAGSHTLLWVPRSWKAMREHRRRVKESRIKLQYQRFTPYQRILHALVIVSFLSLALTGMILKFSDMAWAQWMSGVMGGFDTTGYIHRFGAIITFFYFFAHLFSLARDKRKERKSWREVLFDAKSSMLPNRQDLSDFAATMKWFLGKGPQPEYGRWTYWEKFDYFAVFWGVAIIGTTGLMLWQPELFTHFLPGWTLNLATIIHSDEALLAVAFIFTIHFFNTHFRPDKFPMDTVIFTGRVSVEELKKERPREYEDLVKSGKLKRHLVPPLPENVVKGMRVFGALAVIIGVSLILLIVYSLIFGGSH